MGASHVYVPLARLVILFTSLLVVGTGLTVPLFKFDWGKFARSSLFVKILFWIPIFLLFLGVLYLSNPWRLIILGVLLAMAIREFVLAWRRRSKTKLLTAYLLIFCLALAHFALIEIVYPAIFINILISLAIASVLGDVTAFFLGNYFGRHKLPAAINDHKSWEGVFGQFAGALAGILLVNNFVEPVISLWLFVPIGAGCALGDLGNSFVKRKLDIKDWSRAIPGHGGFADRLSSLAGSAVLVFYYLKIIGF